MNDHSLPENMASWPSDPYELLGVKPGIGANELRRAYTRLIRTYKPEQFSDHFRRIREAYESVLAQIEFYKAIGRISVDDDNPPVAESTPPEADSPTVIVQPWRQAPSDAEELDQLWQRASKGEEAAVYRRLVELHESQPGRADLLLRLYWLLALTPEIDTKRSPCDWLAQGLRTSGLGGPLWELYRRAVVENPDEAVSERCTALMRMPAGAGPLADLAELRWQAACKLGRWQVIDHDLKILHDRFNDDGETWMRLVIFATERLAVMQGTEPQELVQECQKQLTRHAHLHTRLADALDRLELHLETAGAARRIEDRARVVPPALTQLISRSLTHSQDELRSALMAYLEQMVRDPRTALEDLDRLQRRASPLLAQFSNILVQFRGGIWPYLEEGRSREFLGKMVRDFFDEMEYTTYPDLRAQLLEMCIAEAISPEVVAELAGNDHLAHQLMNDWPLRCVWLGCRLFWM